MRSLLGPALQSRTLLSSRMWSLSVLLELELVRHGAAAVFREKELGQMSSKCSTASRFAGKQDPYAVLTLGDQNHRSKTITGKIRVWLGGKVGATGTGCAKLTELSSRADGGKDPVWNEKFTFHNVSADAQFLKLEVRGDEAQPQSACVR